MREFKIENDLVNLVESEGGRAIKFTSSNNRGVPDRMCLFPGGILLFVELKAPGKTLDPLQVVWFRILRGLGFLCVMSDSFEKNRAIIRWYRKQRRKNASPRRRIYDARNDQQDRKEEPTTTHTNPISCVDLFPAEKILPNSTHSSGNRSTDTRRAHRPATNRTVRQEFIGQGRPTSHDKIPNVSPKKGRRLSPISPKEKLRLWNWTKNYKRSIPRSNTRK